MITWEHQATDYPECGANMPGYEPRGCPRGASFSWYEYSPVRIKYPYIRGKLWQLWTDAKKQYDNPIDAWGSIVEDPEKKRNLQSCAWPWWHGSGSPTRGVGTHFSAVVVHH